MANTKRKDSKKRGLREGEGQAKNGRYYYNYIDQDGERRFLYSWRLVPTDKMPAGKPWDISLREKEAQLENSRKREIEGKRLLTLYEAMLLYASMHKKLKPTSLERWNQFSESIKNEPLGKCPVDQITLTEIFDFFQKKIEKGLKYKSIDAYRKYFRTAVKYYLDVNNITGIKNPFIDELPFLADDEDDNDLYTTRDYLTEEDLGDFMEYLETHRKYVVWTILTIMRHTGMRIGEVSGLRMDCIDLENDVIHINRQVVRLRGGVYKVITPKSREGIRFVPMSEPVKQAILKQIERRNNFEVDVPVDGYSKFLFVSKDGTPISSNDMVCRITRQRDRYNKLHPDKPIEFHSHQLRKDFTTSALLVNNIPLKTVMTIVGHRNPDTTLAYYTKPQREDIIQAFQKIYQES